MSTLDAVLKNFYTGPVRDQLNNKTPLMAQLKKSTKEVQGKIVVLPLRSGRNHGIGARGTTGTGTLPTAGNQQYKEANFLTKDNYARIQIDGKTIRATKTDQGAFIRAVDSEIKGAVTDLKNDINRQLFGDGSGTLAVAGTGATSATVPVANTQYLEEGMVIDFNGGAGGSTTGAVILSIDSEIQITLVAAATWTTSDPIRLTGVGTTDELNGLDLITANTGTLQAISPVTDYTGWKGNVYGTAGSPVPLTEDDMQEVVDTCEKKGGSVDLIFTSYKGRKAYSALLTTQKRYTTPDATKLKGGYKFIDFNDKPIVVDKHCQESSTETRMYFLDNSTLGIYRMADFDWMQEDGSVLSRVSNKEAYEATLVCDMEFATKARRHNGRLQGIQST